MGRRVTLTDRDIATIQGLIMRAVGETTLDYAVIKVGKEYLEDLSQRLSRNNTESQKARSAKAHDVKGEL